MAWPIWSALNSMAGYALTVPAGALTIVLCGFALHFIARGVNADTEEVVQAASIRVRVMS